MDFKSKLISLRTTHNLSQSDLSKVTNIPEKKIKAYEDGKKLPPFQDLQSLATYYNLPVEDFYKYPEANNNYARYFDLRKMTTIKIIWYTIYLLFMVIPWQTYEKSSLINDKIVKETITTSALMVDNNKYVMIGVILLSLDLVYSLVIRFGLDHISSLRVNYIISKVTKVICIIVAFACFAWTYGFSSLSLL